MSANDQSQPSLVAGHAEWVKGAAVEAIGNVSGSEEWKTSGAESKQSGLDQMQKASENRDPQQQGFGRVEEMAGKAVGCEGMQTEGAESKEHSQ